MKKKLSLNTLKVDTFEPVRQQSTNAGSVYGYSGQYGPACASEDPNCNDTGVFGPACRSEWPNCGGQTSICV